MWKQSVDARQVAWWKDVGSSGNLNLIVFTCFYKFLTLFSSGASLTRLRSGSRTGLYDVLNVQQWIFLVAIIIIGYSHISGFEW